MRRFSDSDEDDYNDEIRPPNSTSPHKHDIIVGSYVSKTQNTCTVTPLERSYGDGDDKGDIEDIDSCDDTDDLEDDPVYNDKVMGKVGCKWRVRVLRVNDSEESWKGVCEIYFHWSKDTDKQENVARGVRKRRKRRKLTDKEKHSIVNIDQPEKCPIFIILNEEDSNSIEEMYYIVPAYPDVMFGYVAWTVIVHERLELEV